jgi:hypothetical protein
MSHVAGGYALVTGRGQGVLVHVDVGTANAANATRFPRSEDRDSLR